MTLPVLVTCPDCGVERSIGPTTDCAGCGLRWEDVETAAAFLYEVVYYEPTARRWEFARRFDTREEADKLAHELRVAGRDARVTEEPA